MITITLNIDFELYTYHKVQSSKFNVQSYFT